MVDRLPSSADAKLLHHAARVVGGPFFLDLAIRETVNDDPLDLRPLPLVGATCHPAGHDLVPFGGLVDDLTVQIRHEPMEPADQLLQALGATHLAFTGRSMADEAGAAQLVDGVRARPRPPGLD